PLCFTTRQGGRALTQADVGQAYINQGSQFARNGRDRIKVFQCLLNRQVQHFADIAATVANIQRLAVVASALADITRYIHVRQEVHLYLDHAVALAGLAAAALDVKGEATWVVTAQT